MVSLDPYSPTRAWAAAADRLYRSDDLGLTWRAFGGLLPEPQTSVRGIAADENATAIVVTTHRGMYRSEDGAQTWALKEGNLPIHLESGPLTRDPSDARVLYAVYSLLPYGEVWRTAIEGGNLLAHLDPVSIAGGVAFILLLLGGGIFLVRLARAAARGGPAHPPRAPLIAMKAPLSRRNGLFVVLALAAAAIAATIAFLMRGGPEFVEYRMPQELESPTAIAAGADGAVWFTIDRSDVIGRVRNGAVDRLSTSGRNLEPLGIGVAPDGSAWFTDSVGGRRRSYDRGRARCPASSSTRRSCGLGGWPFRPTARPGLPS